MQANPKAKKLLVRVMLPLYGVAVVWVIVASIMFHEKRTIDQIDPTFETFYLLEDTTLKSPVGEVPGTASPKETEVVFVKGTKIDREFVELWRYNIGRNYRKADETIPVTGRGSIIGLNLTLPLVLMNFAVLLVLLRMLLWDPIIQILDKRAETIKGDLEAAGTAKAEAEQARGKYLQQLRSSRAERAELISAGERLGNEQAQRIVERAREEAARIVTEARRQIGIEADRARAELRAELGRMAARLAERILRREVNASDHSELVDGFLKDLETETQKQTS